jgi:hypothetical protein
MIDSSRTLVLLTSTVIDTLNAIMLYASYIRGEIRLALPGYIPVVIVGHACTQSPDERPGM